MEKRTEGAWLIHHTKKLFDVRDTQDFEDIELAGKCGIFLSNLAADENTDLNKDKVDAIAKASSIKKTEIETIKNKLVEAHLIDVVKNGGISVLGITTSTVLSHTANIFDSSNSNNYQKAALELSERISDLPKPEKELKEYISDEYKLTSRDTVDLFSQCEEIGFIDYENLDNDSKFYFNGNLFRKENIQKTNAILNSLNSDDSRKILEMNELLSKKGCITFEKAKAILGEVLLTKLQSIGMYDFNEVSNSHETKTFVTKPSAFSKYGNPFEEDALDLAKAFVSSLYYGMNFSSSGRGRITMLNALMRKLVNGFEVGQHTAQPASVDVVHAAAQSLVTDGLLSLLLGADEQDVAALSCNFLHVVVSLVQLLHGLLQIDDVDTIALGEDVLCHLGVPAAGLVAKVDTGLEKLFHRYDCHCLFPPKNLVFTLRTAGFLFSNLLAYYRKKGTKKQRNACVLL